MESKEEEYEQEKVEGGDDLEPLLVEVLENKEVFESLMNILKRLKDAGIISLMDNVSRDYMTTDVEFLGKFFTSKEFSVGLIKTGNLLIGAMHALSNEKTSDTLKAVLFNEAGITDTMLNGAKNPEQMSLLKMYSMIKDPEVASGLTAVLNALKFIGQVLKTVGD